MTLAEKIVGMILDDEPTLIIDPRQHPDMYKPAYEAGNEQVFSGCAWCERERFQGSRKQYATGTSVSHGICPRHKDVVLAKARTMKPFAATPPKATFWPTSGSGA